MAALCALALVVLAVLYLAVLAPAANYTLHARFIDAGQLVRGDLVEVGGRQVGSISAISLAANGEADLALHIDDGSLLPLHQGTTATIRQVGLVTITNRYVELDPGPADGPALPSGGVLSDQYTHGIVDADELLDSMDPASRARFAQILAATARALRAPTAAQFNGALGLLDPALSQTAAFAAQATRDRPALAALVRNLASVSTALATRPDQLTGAVQSTAAALRQLAHQRAAVADLLGRAPRVLDQADGTLGLTRTTLAQLDPFLADLRPVAPRAGALLSQLLPVLINTGPAVSALRALLPQATNALQAVPGATRRATPAIGAGTRALRTLLPIVNAFRPYAPDLVAGLFNGFGGANSGYYDANGHYARIALELGPGGTFGLLTPMPPQPSGGYRTGMTARCPGAAIPPAVSGANPWVIPGLCDPSQGQR